MQEIIEINKKMSKIKKWEKGLRITIWEKRHILINTFKIEINKKIGIKDYIALKKPILLITLKMKKEIK